ncbi:hypothetical protein SAMN05661091_1026 [Paenibacillus uliginis N3/975]|uniref:DUF7408 domain-containing protein n=1 Tax=Paenibacillus uliginis N3/975 TaxID=1313296 RepID=A0A1X7GS99_9BACL|nr:hypothetical protein [Paenibacillus uliginis]SMF73961.1 hypothetical protein SAMN05661091_1026 [Paenibacillus uliginis N3/975]
MFRWLSFEGEGNHHLSFYKKLTGIMVLSMVLLFTAVLPYPFQGGTAYADGPEIGIKTELGYKGNIKQDKWNPLKLILTSDRDISGDIVLRVNNTNGMGQEAAYVQHVELPKDTPKEITIGIPGFSYSKDNNEITFYEGSYKNGKPISFSTGKNYIQKSAMMGGLVGVLSDDQDTMNFLSALNGKGSSLIVIPLKEEDISNDSMLLNGLDVLVINNFASDTLSQQKQESITNWVKSGGTLVLSGGAGYAKTAAPFENIAPVKLNGTTTVESLPELQKLGGKPLKLEEEFTISTAEPVKGAVVDSQTSGVPLFASRNVEQGKVWYAAYDVAMEPVSSWGGHSDVWASILRSDLPLSNNVYYGSMIDNLSYVLDYFPSLKMPSFQVLMWLLIIYALIVAPILYYILKKTDKREWAWFLIPLIAIIASGTVYMIGSSDKTEEMAHTINIMELDGKGSAVKSTASAFFTPRSGDYELEFPKNTYLKTQNSNGAFGRGAAENKSYIRVGEEQTKLELKNMPQWSLAKMWAENTVNEETGQLKVDLKLDDKGQLAGKVINETTNDLKEVVLVIGGKAHKMGDIARKSSADVPVSGKSVVKVMAGDLSNILYPFSSNDQYSRQREILSTYSYRRSNTVKDAFIFGWSDDTMTNYKLKGKEVQSDQLNFWTQPVSIDWNQNGTVNIPYGFLVPQVTQSNAPTFYVSPHGVEIAQGTMIAEFPLMSETDAKYSEFSIKGTKLSGGMTMEIWNAADNAWEPIPDNNNVFTVKGNTEKYIVDKRIRFSVTAKDQVMFQMPELSLKGEVIE